MRALQCLRREDCKHLLVEWLGCTGVLKMVLRLADSRELANGGAVVKAPCLNHVLTTSCPFWK